MRRNKSMVGKEMSCLYPSRTWHSNSQICLRLITIEDLEKPTAAKTNKRDLIKNASIEYTLLDYLKISSVALSARKL